MILNRTPYLVATALVAALAIAGCKKDAPAPEATAPAPPPAMEPSAPMTPMEATVSISAVDLGTAVGPDMRVTTPATTFSPGDIIIAAVSTNTSDPAATVTGTLGAKWSFEDGQVVNEETKDVSFTDAGVTNFQISKPDGWPTGSYTLDVTLDGKVVESRKFDVR
jgi:hypothetical protein